MTIDTSMSYLDSLRSTSASGATSQTRTTGSNTIDEAGFLKLLTAQMTQQDPTQPMDSNQMVSQLSQMSTVSGITEMNTSLKSLLSEITGNRIGDAASWIGKAALLNGNVAMPLANGGYAGQITLPSDASRVNLSLVDATGATVYSQTFDNQKAGPVNFGWNGAKADGTTVTGPLRVVVSAAGVSGTINLTTATWATITGVQSPAGGSSAQLSTTLGAVAPTDVLSLS